MVKAVFFDWMNTLAHPEPDRHEYYCRVARELRKRPGAIYPFSRDNISRGRG